MTLLSYRSTVTGDVAVISLSGELDVSGASTLESEIERLVADHDPRGLVLDLSQLAFMDSTGLRLVVLTDAKAREEGRTFAIVRGTDDVHRVFEITRMTDRLRFLDSADDAPSIVEAP